MDGIYAELGRRFDAGKLLGYLNFSDGRPDLRFRKLLADVFAHRIDAGDTTPWQTTADWLARAACVVLLLVSFAVPVIEYLRSPHGQWDAWAIWNQKARFLFRAGEGWTASLAIPWSAPGHPLLVSLSVARLWAYAGAERTAAPVDSRLLIVTVCPMPNETSGCCAAYDGA